MKKSAFVEVLGETPFVKVLDFLIDNRIFDYSKTEVAREIGISRMTIDSIWKMLIKRKIIVKTKKIGNAELHRLNVKNPIVVKLRELDITLAKNTYLKEKSPVEILA
jgi:hypothetical protein